MNISIGNDHAGTAYKFKIIEHLKKKIVFSNHTINHISIEFIMIPIVIFPQLISLSNSFFYILRKPCRLN
mgnify:CR=1 FL=1